jgi:hypothetical protein
MPVPAVYRHVPGLKAVSGRGIELVGIAGTVNACFCCHRIRN